MENHNAEIERLKKEIEILNEDLYTAATAGNQLLEENNKLKHKANELLHTVELLEQEKHSLQLNLETQNQTVKSQSNDLEIQRERTDSLNEKFEANEREKQVLQKKNESLMKEILFIKKAQDDLSIENASLKEKVSLLMKQISNFENQAEKSLCEADKDETQELQTQLSTYMLNNKELKDALSSCQYELETAKKNEKHLMQLVQELEETVSEKNSEISNLSEEIKKTKEDMEELQGEIEILKFDQIDVKKRGNSVFAELDDRRTLVEKEYKILRKKFEQFQKQYEENKKELDQARGQIAISQSMASREYETYLDELENSLASARLEVTDLTHKLSEALKIKIEKTPVEKPTNEYDYLRVMLEKSRKNEKELQMEIMRLKSINVEDENKLIRTRRMLYKSKEDLHCLEQENLKLKNKIKDLELGNMYKLPTEPPTREPRIERVECPSSTVTEKTELLNKSIFNMTLDLDMIPGEIEFCEDGIKQTKPARKSNKFILKEFNKIDTGEKKNERNLSVPSAIGNKSERKMSNVAEKSISASRGSNITDKSMSATRVSNVTDKSMSVTRSRQRHSKNNRYENCAQQ